MTATMSEALPQYVARPRVSVVIPALNEARNLPLVAGRMPAGIDEIIFVNGDSQDNTAEVARQLWPDAVHIQQTRKGKGNALACGFAAASGDIIVMIDADGSTDPAEIPRFVDALISGAHFAKGSRFIQGGGSTDITPFRRLGNRHLNNLVNLLFTTNYTDLCYGFNAFWRQCLDIMCLPDVSAQRPQWGDGFEIETLMSVRLAANHANVVEVASYEFKRIYGVSNLNAVADGLRVLSTIHREFSRTLAAPKLPYSANGKTNGEVVHMNDSRRGHYLRYSGRPLIEVES
jgi:glycosyltransferase involved in cell wall biosynthesis